MLAAIAVGSSISHDGTNFLLSVDESQVELALMHLRQFDAENRPLPDVASRALHPASWTGCVVYAAALLGVPVAVSTGLWPAAAFEAGALDAALVQQGQWWRAWTALTLHLDVSHLAMNLGAGVGIGYFAARQLGGGTAWLLMVTGAALANLLECLLGPAAHRSVGASTAVFAGVGLVSANAWLSRLPLPQRWARRWAPLVSGVVLLGLFGSAGENTDLVAHLLGLLVGMLFGAAAALRRLHAAFNNMPQWLAGLAALTCVAFAWWLALAS